MGGRARRAALIAIVVGAIASGSAPALADSLLVPNTNWTALLPPLPGTPDQPQPGPVPNCETPSVHCIDTEIERMTELRDRLGCDHRAVFPTTYLELTKEIRRTVETDAGRFQDLNYLYTEDALFANFYFDTWRPGRTEDGSRLPGGSPSSKPQAARSPPLRRCCSGSTRTSRTTCPS